MIGRKQESEELNRIYNRNKAELVAVYGRFIAYDSSGQIIYMQYTNEGRLVTFDGKSFEVKNGGSFVNYRN